MFTCEKSNILSNFGQKEVHNKPKKKSLERKRGFNMQITRGERIYQTKKINKEKDRAFSRNSQSE